MNTSIASRRTVLLPACALLLGAIASVVGATDISSQPLATLPKVKAKPNLMFILDDSGSMNYSYMPDELGESSSGTDEPYTNWRGYWSAQCNGLAYDPDPAQTYPPPLKADGTSYPNATYPNAKKDGYTSSSSDTTDLSGAYYYSYSGSQPKMGWVYTTSGVTNNAFYQECSSTSSSRFTKVQVSSLTAADKVKYANWYSYYRKRYLLMRTAMGRAISQLDEGYRVGFSTIHDTRAVDGSNSVSNDMGYFRDVKDFDATQKTRFYSSLYGATPGDSTPLRTALSKAGLYYARKAPGQTYDPVQYACQRNYTLLSTDGYWNGGKGVRLDGATIGQQDGTEARPMKDDATITVTSVTRYTAPASSTEIKSQARTFDWTRTETTVSRSFSFGCLLQGGYAVTKQTQTYNQTSQTQTFSTPRTATASYQSTVVTTDGVVTSGPTSSAETLSGWTYTGTAATATVNGPDKGAPGPNSYTDSGPATSAGCQGTAGNGQSSYSTGSGAWSAWSALVTTNTTPAIGAYDNGVVATTSTSSGGTADTLADGAEYFWKSDLRTTALGNCTSTTSSGQDLCSNIVPTLGSDTATWQHMNTYTIGLGVSGTLPYDKNYLTQTAGAYVNLSNGPTNWPPPSNTQNSNGTEDARNVDDLWHAAVNGRGQYYSALNASALTEAINGVVTAVQAVSGSASAASTSSLELVAGDNNKVFGASYTTAAWTGDLKAYALTGEDASIGDTPLWSAQSLLDATAASARKIYFGNGNVRQDFQYANLSATQKAYFDNMCSKSVQAAQCASLSTSDKALAESGTNLVAWLRGTRTYESTSAGVAALYRKRDHVLGDIINGAPQYVGKPPFNYADSGYANYASASATRTPVVYVAANDGMLHAFSAATGVELWAYVPTAVMPNLYKLADTSYASRHQYYVDAAPVIGDIKVGSSWKTILVGGLGSGGAGYYALDITDPANPLPLWEFTNTNLGLTHGNPMITKRADGTWVVALTSGYNNTAGDGKGHLYLLNANTGALLLDISTGVGSSTDPSGLAKINAWVGNTTDNTAQRFYGGDLKGNLWRFDVDNLVLPNQKALLLARLQTNASTPQPITTKPQPAEISGKPVIVVGTGRYLGTTDIEDTAVQSVYAIKDPLTATGWDDVRASNAFVSQTLSLNRDGNGKALTASISDNPVDWTTKAGWRVDLPQAGERVSSNMVTQFTTLAFASTIPTGNACDSGGSSWIYFLDITNGGVITSNPVGALFSSNSLIVGLSWVQTSSGNSKIVVQGSSGDRTTGAPQVDGSGPSGGGARRTSWRELVD
ncbi:pilus assembly protein [Variovorax rhizosphaerae]|uniref:PilC/PilY family type IV pilus protein n=1 Tax=Variovorax rhizosphaerae TaxID=1836200 RepID=A0ABU8WE05_9BURK